MIPSAHIIKQQEAIGQSQQDRRIDERYEIPIDVKLDIIANNGGVLERVPALVINISRSGACIITDVQVNVGTFIVMQMVHETFYTSALVVDVKQAGAAVRRLHVQFVGTEWTPADYQR